MESIISFRSPLRDNPPAAGEALGGAVTKRVVVILVDALRLDTSLNAEVMPYLQELRRLGATARMHSRPPSYSEPGYTVILTGAWPELSDGPPINLPYEEILVFTQDDIFSAASQAGITTAVSGYYWFEKLIPQSAVDMSFYTPGEDQAADRKVVDAVLPWLEEGHPGLVLVHIDQVDYAGHHEGGPRDARWNQASRRADDLIREMAAGLDFSRDTLLIISDHGQIDAGGHGGYEAVTLLEPFVLVGAGVTPGEYGDVGMADVAPTLAALLGTRLPASSQGAPQVRMLDLSAAQITRVNALLQKQQAGLLAAYRDAIGSSPPDDDHTDVETLAEMETLRQTRLQRERLPRFGLALLAVLASAAIFYSRRPPTWGWYLAGAFATQAVFHLRYAVIDQKTYSLSSVNSVDDLFGYIAITILLGFLAGWLMLVLALKLHRLPPGAVFDQTLRFTLVILYFTFLPALWCYILNDFAVTWTLPDFPSAFLGFLSLLQAIFLVGVGLLVACVAALTARITGKTA